MSRVVVFYSLTGHARQTAERLAKALNARMVEIVERRPRTSVGRDRLRCVFDSVFSRHPAIRSEDCAIEPGEDVVLCFPVWAARMAGPARTWLTENGRKAASLALAIHTRSGRMFPGVVREARHLAGRAPTWVVTIAEDEFKTDGARLKALALVADVAGLAPVSG
jgi:hypothetical protein